MSSLGNPPGPIYADVLERLGHATSFEEACAVILGRVLERRSGGRGILLGRVGTAVAAGGWKVGPVVVREARAAAANPMSSLAALFSRTEVGRFDTASAPRLGDFRADILIPLPSSIPTIEGMLLAESVTDPEHVELLEEVFARCSGILFRLFELDHVRGERDRLSREGVLHDRMLDVISDPVLLTDSDANIVVANPRARELFSSQPNDGEGRLRAIRLNTALFSTRLAAENIPGEGTGSGDLNLVDPVDGSDLLFEMRTSHVPGDHSTDHYQLSVLRDITDLKRATEELEIAFQRSKVAVHQSRQEGERIRAILENVAEPILVTDSSGSIVLMNRESERLFEAGPHHDETVEEKRRGLWTNATRLTSFVNDLLLRQERRRRGQFTLLDPESGASFPVEATGAKITDARGHTTSVVTVLRDLTPVVENRRLAQELQAFNDELESRIEAATAELEERNRILEWQREELRKASLLKSQFLASMSHELRTPINAVLGYTALLQESIYGPINPEQQEVLGKVDGASEHLLELINDVLDLSKIEAGRMTLRVEDVELEELVNEVRTNFEPRLIEQRLDLRIELTEELPMVRTDRTKLRQVLINLLDNGMKYTDEGWIALRVGTVGADRIEFQVEDTGRGISQEDVDHIFEDFRQGQARGSWRPGGVGLGLAISRKLVALLGGSIGVETSEGEGTCFTIELPVRLASSGAETGGLPESGLRPTPPPDPGS